MVQEAVNATPSNLGPGKFVIWIKTGLYDEIVRVQLEKRNVVFVGEGMDKTVITGSLSVGLMPGMTTYESAAVGPLGQRSMAQLTDISMQQLGPSVPRPSPTTAQFARSSGLGQSTTTGPIPAPAMQPTGPSISHSSWSNNPKHSGYRCWTSSSLPIRQRPFRYPKLRVPRRSRHSLHPIVMPVLTIMSRSGVTAHGRLDPEKGENNAVTAHGRLDPGQSTGFIFQNCSINGTEEYMNLYHSNPKLQKKFLGRPWKEYSRTVFINCNLEVLVCAEGWMPWNGEFALETLYYGEFNSSGAGANVTGRLSWSSQIPAEHVNSYSVVNFIQGDKCSFKVISGYLHHLVNMLFYRDLVM
ncbi:hypothetical protein RND71_022056 [Anisodus tanguticus]|uniref:Pectinesterase catalytic domain-containing protein n=1 Tax=Anisodus tanguticus TaxID=243964 RepID=A0AAE1V8T2_9SOLA|nr:hypothetical protein RND71_022056 [Anisodus tanguticus]